MDREWKRLGLARAIVGTASKLPWGASLNMGERLDRALLDYGWDSADPRQVRMRADVR